MKHVQELDPRRDFPRWLRTVRTRSRLSQTRLGEEIGAFGGEISWWEAAKSKPSHEQLQRLFEFFAVEQEPDLTALPPVEEEVEAAPVAVVVEAAPVVVEAAPAPVSPPTRVARASVEQDEDDDELDDEESDDEASDDEAAAAGGASHPLALPVPPREELEQLYLRRKLSIKLIGEHFGVSTRTARKWLRESGIELRSLSEQMRHSARRGESGPAPAAPPTPAAPPEPPRPVDLTRSVRVRRRDELRPARRAGAEYDIDDETGRVVRIAPPMPELPMAPPPAPEPEDNNGRVRVLDLSDELQRSPRPTPERRMRLVAPPMRSSGSRPRAASPSSTSLTFEAPRPPRDNVMHTATRASGLGAAAAALSPAGAPGNVHRPHAELVRWHLDDGFSIPELAQRTGQPARAVREQLREAGIKIRSWREPLPIGRTEEIPPRETLARQVHLGVELEDLASSYEVSIARVRGWFDRHNLVPETHTRVASYTRIDGKQAAIVAIADGTSLTVDPELSFEMAAHSWTLDAGGRPITRHAGTDIPLSWFALGREPGEALTSIEHLNGDVLDCRRANLKPV